VLPWYWWSLGVRQLLFLGIIVAQVRALRAASTPPASADAAPADAAREDGSPASP